jgi:hypothetical protein
MDIGWQAKRRYTGVMALHRDFMKTNTRLPAEKECLRCISA